MAQQINVNIRMDKDIKEQADALFSDLGFNLTTAVNAFVRQAIRDIAIPFHIEAKSSKDRYNDYFNSHNMKILMESSHQGHGENIQSYRTRTSEHLKRLINS